METSDLS